MILHGSRLHRRRSLRCRQSLETHTYIKKMILCGGLGLAEWLGTLHSWYYRNFIWWGVLVITILYYVSVVKKARFHGCLDMV